MRVRVPLPYRSRARAYGRASEEDISRAIRHASRREVPLSLLRALQHTVGSDRLAQYEGDPTTRSKDGSPLIIERRGKLYVRNGHHRATAAVRRGDRTLPARVAHLGPSEPIRFREGGRVGDLLMIDPRAMAATYRPRDVQDVAEVVGDVAVLDISGPLESKASQYWWSFGDDYESVLCRFRTAIESDDVRAVLMKIDSPGGAAAGLNECVDAMLRCKAETGKPVYAYVDESCYSAAYALACAADEIYLPRAGGVGSIGVVSQLVDFTEANRIAGVRVEVIVSGARKADFNPDVAITPAAVARVQRRVMQLARIYWQLVKDTRGVSARKLEADTFYGADAVAKGLADGVMSLDAVMGAIADRLDNPRAAASSLAHGTGGARGANRERHTMSRILKLTAEVRAAQEAFAAAPRKQKDEAEAALVLAESKLSRELAKVTKNTKTTKVTDVHESESSSSKSSESSSSSSASEAESESASETESASESASVARKDEKEVLSLVRQMTGKVSLREALGALEAMKDVAAVGPKAAKKLATLMAERQNRKVEDLIAAGRASHKITPGNEAKARKIAAKHGHRALAAFLDAAMPAIDGHETIEAEDVGGGVTITQEQRKMWTKLGHKEEDFPKLAKAVQAEQARLTNGGIPTRGRI